MSAAGSRTSQLVAEPGPPVLQRTATWMGAFSWQVTELFRSPAADTACFAWSGLLSFKFASMASDSHRHTSHRYCGAGAQTAVWAQGVVERSSFPSIPVGRQTYPPR